jgi:hypothetical protein
MSRSIDNQKRPLILRVIYHPMFYVSLLLHGLVFAIPGTPEPEVPPELDPEEEQSVEITMLDPIIEPEPEIELEEPDPEPPPTDEPPPQAAKPPAPEPVAPPEQQAPPPEPSPEEEPLPEYDPSGDRQRITGNLDNVEGYTDVKAHQLRLFLSRSARSDFLTEDAGGDDVPREGIFGFTLLNDIKLEGGGGVTTTFDPLSHIRFDTDTMTLVQLTGQTFGNGPIYEVQRIEDREPVFWANAIPSSSGGSSTVVFYWEYNPTTPPEPEGGES